MTSRANPTSSATATATAGGNKKKFDPRRKSFFESEEKNSATKNNNKTRSTDQQANAVSEAAQGEGGFKFNAKRKPTDNKSKSSSPNNNNNNNNNNNTVPVVEQPAKRSRTAAAATKPDKLSSTAIPSYPITDISAYPSFDYPLLADSKHYNSAYYGYLVNIINAETQQIKQTFSGQSEYVANALEVILADFGQQIKPLLLEKHKPSPSKQYINDLVQPNFLNSENEIRLQRFGELIEQIDKQIAAYQQLQTQTNPSNQPAEQPIIAFSAEEEKFLRENQSGSLVPLIESQFTALSTATDSSLQQLKQLQGKIMEISEMRENFSEEINRAAEGKFGPVGGIHDAKKLIQGVTKGRKQQE
jgi:hypothetical protein